jgi:hypothetical protein
MFWLNTGRVGCTMRVILECRARSVHLREFWNADARMRHIRVTGEGNRANSEPIFFARSLLRVNLEWRSGGCAKFCARNFECKEKSTGVLKHRARTKLEIYSKETVPGGGGRERGRGRGDRSTRPPNRSLGYFFVSEKILRRSIRLFSFLASSLDFSVNVE